MSNAQAPVRRPAPFSPTTLTPTTVHSTSSETAPLAAALSFSAGHRGAAACVAVAEMKSSRVGKKTRFDTT